MTYVIVVFFCTTAGICTQGSLANNFAHYNTSESCWTAVKAMGQITTSSGDRAFLGCEPDGLFPGQPGYGFWTTSP